MADTKTFEISPDTEIDHDNSSKEDLPAPKPEYHAPPEQQTELEVCHRDCAASSAPRC
jgi:hypothetical protein